ncbi:hypothetical protein NKG94_13535 [Micromonospora sp. M12]
MLPGRLRRRLTIAFVLVAGVSAGLLAGGTGLLLRQSWWDASLHEAAADARYQLVLAGQFLPLTERRSTELLTSFEASGRHVVLVDGPAAPRTPRTRRCWAPACGPSSPTAARLPALRTGGTSSAAGGRRARSRVDSRAVRPHRRGRRRHRPGSAARRAGGRLGARRAARRRVGHTLARRTLEPVGGPAGRPERSPRACSPPACRYAGATSSACGRRRSTRWPRHWSRRSPRCRPRRPASGSSPPTSPTSCVPR